MGNNDYFDFTNGILTPAIFDNADRVFSWLDFTKVGRDWQTPHRLDGSISTKRKDKTVLRAKFPYLLIENGKAETRKDTITYFQEYQRLATYHEAVKELSKALGLKVPNSYESKELTEEQQKQLEKRYTTKSINHYVAIYASAELRKGLNGKSGIATDVIKYLKEARNWSNDYIEYLIDKLRIGVIPDTAKLKKDLIADYKENDKEVIEEIIAALNNQKGYDLKIILWSGNEVVGFKGRNIREGNRYNNAVGERPIYDLGATTGKDKSVYFVEGELDALALSYLGKNVIALSGANSGKAIDYAVGKGYQSFTILPDYDGLPSEVLNSGLTRADKALTTFQSIVDGLQKHGVSTIYVAPINPPTDKADKWDVDKLLNYDKAALETLLKSKVRYYHYFAGMMLESFNGKVIDVEAIDKLQNSLITYRLTNADTQTLTEYYKAYSEILKNVGSTPLTEAEFKAYRKEYADRWKNKEIIEGLRKEIDVTLRDLNNGLSSGRNEADMIQATKDLGRKLTQAKTAEKVSEHKRVAYWTEAEIADDLNKISEGGIDSGITLKYDKLIFPNAAISTIAGVTGAGKTAFLVQSMLNAIKNDKNKKLLYISLEERATAIIARFINGLYDDGNYYENENINFLETNRIIRTTSDYKEKNKAIIYSRLRAKEDSFTYKDNTVNDAKLNNAVKEFFALQDANRLRIAAVDYDYLELLELISNVNSEVGGLDGVFIDYIQLIKIRPNKETRANSRQEELKHICIALNEYAKATNIPIVVGCQFNREVRNIDDLHETKLGEAGDIERISNVIVALFKTNSEMKNLPINKDLKQNLKDERFRDNQIFAKLLKNRDGENNLSECLAFNGNTGKICNYAKDIDKNENQNESGKWE